MSTEENKVTSATEWEDIPAEKFQIIGTDDFSGDIIARPKVGYWADAWRRFRENNDCAGCFDYPCSYGYHGNLWPCNLRI